ncbi:glycoside hydrolase family 16 protein [Mycena sp. CBHHK59/15]|nr:glycoside hydrolase family 16 protein [Mycena sp. CBHHK59/15]
MIAIDSQPPIADTTPAMHINTLALSILLSCFFCYASDHNTRDSGSQCQSFHTSFDQSSMYPSPGAHFIPISPEGSYSLTSSGLELYLHKPEGPVTTATGVNDKIGNGATINSTFVLFNGKVTIQASSPTISGVVVASILIGDSSSDEVDIEFICGEPTKWQTNLFVPDPRDTQPAYGVFSSKEDVDSITKTHSYSIDFNRERIAWALTGRSSGRWRRTNLGIWDASAAAGTAEWARGPVDWTHAPDKITAVIRSVTVECE